ncbi:MAG: diacylglycerol/lipid kinase family protein [Bacteroidia bacterium]|jgi:diacylglycerol kinase (ATP)
MSTDKSFLFIVNPISGGRDKRNIIRKIEHFAHENGLNFRIEVPESSLKTKQYAQEAVSNKTFAVVACGGDGTVNDVASQLVHTETLLGIIPMGSGNGLAREMGLPFDVEKAIKLLAKHEHLALIDSGQVNEHFFVNIAGIGFDAHVANLFSSSSRRGLRTYLNIIFSEFFNYPEKKYTLITANNEIEISGFVLAVCNGKQFGNNFIIAKNAQTNDGRFEIVALSKPRWHELPKLLFALQRGKEISTLRFFNCSDAFTIQRTAEDFVNIDGEPVAMDSRLEIKILPQSLRIIRKKI